MLLMLFRILLALVFLLAGITKIFDLSSFSTTLRDFGVPEKWAAPLGRLVPLAEIAVAIALLPLATAWWGALGALALLLTFTAGISVNLARGRKPDCRCFGQLHSEPIGAGVLIRNGLLVALTGFLVWQGQNNPALSIVGMLAHLTLAQMLTLLAWSLVLAALAVQGWFVLHIMRQNGRLLQRLDALEARLDMLPIALQTRGPGSPVALAGAIQAPSQEPAANPAANGKALARRPCCGGKGDAPSSAVASAQGLPVGTSAPAFRLSDLAGDRIGLEELRARGHPVLLIFSSPQYVDCDALLPDLARWQQEQKDRLTVALISQGTLEENLVKYASQAMENVLVQTKLEIADAYQVNTTPGAVLITPECTLGSFAVVGSEAIRAFVAVLTEQEALKALEAAPDAANGHFASNGQMSFPKEGVPQ